MLWNGRDVLVVRDSVICGAARHDLDGLVHRTLGFDLDRLRGIVRGWLVVGGLVVGDGHTGIGYPGP